MRACGTLTGMARPVLLFLLVLLGTAAFVVAYGALREDTPTPPAAGGGGTDAGDATTPPGGAAEGPRARKIRERIADMMPSPEGRRRDGFVEVPQPRPVALPDQVVLEIASGGTVTLDGTDYALGAADEAAAAKAAEALRAVLAKAQAAHGGDAFRESDGRSKLTLVVRGDGASRPDDLHRLLQVVGAAPLRIYRVQFDLQAR